MRRSPNDIGRMRAGRRSLGSSQPARARRWTAFSAKGGCHLRCCERHRRIDHTGGATAEHSALLTPPALAGGKRRELRLLECVTSRCKSRSPVQWRHATRRDFDWRQATAGLSAEPGFAPRAPYNNAAPDPLALPALPKGGSQKPTRNPEVLLLRPARSYQARWAEL
jgi:hypothetical protein